MFENEDAEDERPVTPYEANVGRRYRTARLVRLTRLSRGRLLRFLRFVDRSILHDMTVFQFEHVRAIPIYGTHVMADHDDGDAMPVEFFHGSKES